MALSPGTTIGPYEIQAPLGEGGMGAVYQAHDPTLQRTVAIKVLAKQDEDASARLLQEARAASALNHPHICTIYEVGEHEGQAFIVMEHVEGKPLSALIPADGLPPESVIRYGTQIADALAHAHERGIVHRDLKSQDVVITPEGRAKVLDFGLAARIPQADAEAVTKTQEAIPHAGMLVGTLAYMAPEVLRGEPATARSDIWALGVLLYEMASGKPPFSGTTQTDIVSAIIKEQPATLPVSVSPGLRNVIHHCLTKEPARRYPHPSAIQAALETIQSETVIRRSGSTPAWGSLLRWRTLAVLGGIAMVVLALRMSPWSQTGVGRSRAVPRLSNAVQITVAQGVEDFPTWSPDGRSLAYAAADRAEFRGGNWDIWVTQVGSATPLNRTPDHVGTDSFPSWSPDGLEIAFHSSREGDGLFLMSPLTGPPRQVANVEPPMAARWASSPRWTRDGTRLASLNGQNVDIATLRTGEVSRLPLPGRSSGRRDLSWSPDGRHFVYVVARNRVANITQLWVMRLADGDAWPLTDGRANDWSPTWPPDGRSVFFVTNRGGSMDLWRQRVTSDGTGEGDPEPVTSGIGMRRATFSPDGSRLAYSRGQRVGNLWRIRIPQDGQRATWTDAQQLTFDQSLVSSVNVSPDGQRLAVASDRTGNTDVWVMPAAGGELRQLTTERTPDWMPAWSPDGTRIAFYAFRSGTRHLWTIPAAGGRPQQITDGEAADYQPAWSPDGEELAFYSLRGGVMDVWIVPAGGGEPRQVTSTSGRNFFPQWSPDGAWLVFCSLRSGDARLWRIPARGGSAEQITSGLAWYPSWSRDGDRIYFTGTGEREGNIWQVSPDGTNEHAVTDLGGKPGTLQPAALTTDGEYLLFSWVEDFGDIWVMDVEWVEE